MVRVLPESSRRHCWGVHSCLTTDDGGEESVRDCSSGEQCQDHQGRNGHCDDSWNRTFSPIQAGLQYLTMLTC